MTKTVRAGEAFTPRDGSRIFKIRKVSLRTFETEGGYRFPIKAAVQITPGLWTTRLVVLNRD